MTKEKKVDAFDEGYERPPSAWVKWGKVGDVIKGTYIGNVDRTNKDGSIKMDEEQTMVEAGQVYMVGGKKIIDNVMRRAKIGQKVLFRFSDTFKMPQGVAKTIEVKLGGMDEEYLAPTTGADEINVDEAF